jgi:hypothetical protein
MNSIVIFFVPTGATQQDFELALRDNLPSLVSGANESPAEPDQPPWNAADEPPLWTWFLPNPCP